jgi:thioredoxin-related protein
MKKVILGTGLLVACALVFAIAQPAAKALAPQEVNPDMTTAINWMSWEEAMTASEEEPKKIFIDVYTDWCGWCKRMDANTFTDESIIDYMNENFYAVKFNAEGKEDKSYKGRKLVYRADAGRRGVHELAIVLLNGRLGYPSFVYLDEQQDPLKISPGYKTPEVLLTELKTMVGDQ